MTDTHIDVRCLGLANEHDYAASEEQTWQIVAVRKVSVATVVRSKYYRILKNEL